MKKISQDFFQRDTLTVARELLGKVLVRNYQGRIIKAKIVETEAYIGEEDDACHARHGRTSRNEVMWGEAGHLYVYLCMGLHNLLNIVTEEKDKPAAVLIRKIEPLSGKDKNLKSYGPGNLTRYLKIDRSLNGVDITKSKELYLIDDGKKINPKNIEMLPRVGIEYAKTHKDKLWRFVLKNEK